MNARERMADVNQLRNNIFHDFFRMIIVSGWQDALYSIAYREVNDEHSHFRDAYINGYKKMREIGVSNYKVEDMDISLMRNLASYWNSRAYHGTNYLPMSSQTLDAIKDVKEDRNDDGHSSGNEEEEEIYLQGLLSLINLHKLVNKIDIKETNIPDDKRLAFYQRFTSEIRSLKDTLDNERIELVQKSKQMDQLIQKILNSDEKLNTWHEVFKYYKNQASITDDDKEAYDIMKEFCIRASDAGVLQAHSLAAQYFAFSDPVEAIRRLRMLLDSCQELPLYECHSVMDIINMMLIRGIKLNDDALNIVADLRNRGYIINQVGETFVINKENIK